MQSMATLSSHSGAVTAVEFQHEDKFLAVARWVQPACGQAQQSCNAWEDRLH